MSNQISPLPAFIGGLLIGGGVVGLVWNYSSHCDEDDEEEYDDDDDEEPIIIKVHRRTSSRSYTSSKRKTRTRKGKQNS